ncbi:hypothetical protein GJ496_003348 [Pomphorhynchus laevis]|nr:hypothetical protein GJ496_003348 [Pomphorhynchus laevis]
MQFLSSYTPTYSTITSQIQPFTNHAILIILYSNLFNHHLTDSTIYKPCNSYHLIPQPVKSCGSQNLEIHRFNFVDSTISSRFNHLQTVQFLSPYTPTYSTIYKPCNSYHLILQPIKSCGSQNLEIHIFNFVDSTITSQIQPFSNRAILITLYSKPIQQSLHRFNHLQTVQFLSAYTPTCKMLWFSKSGNSQIQLCRFNHHFTDSTIYKPCNSYHLILQPVKCCGSQNLKIHRFNFVDSTITSQTQPFTNRAILINLYSKPVKCCGAQNLEIHIFSFVDLTITSQIQPFINRAILITLYPNLFNHHFTDSTIYKPCNSYHLIPQPVKSCGSQNLKIHRFYIVDSTITSQIQPFTNRAILITLYSKPVKCCGSQNLEIHIFNFVDSTITSQIQPFTNRAIIITLYSNL